MNNLENEIRNWFVDEIATPSISSDAFNETKFYSNWNDVYGITQTEVNRKLKKLYDIMDNYSQMSLEDFKRQQEFWLKVKSGEVGPPTGYSEYDPYSYYLGHIEYMDSDIG